MEKNDKKNLTKELRYIIFLILTSAILGTRIAIVEKPKGILLAVFLLIIFFLIFIYARELIRIYNKYKNK